MVFEWLTGTPKSSNAHDHENKNCFESTSFRESCHTNEEGVFVCDHFKETWRQCDGDERPKLIHREKEEHVPTDDTSLIAEQIPQLVIPKFPDFDDPLFYSQVMNDIALINDNIENALRRQARLERRERQQNPLPADFPEPEHWKKQK